MAAARRATVVLLHGQPGTGAGWRSVVAALGDEFDIVAPDRPGYRGNPVPPGGLAHNADWVTSVAEVGSDDQPTVVVAHSWAGGVALELAARRPESVQALVLLASVGPGAVTRADRAIARLDGLPSRSRPRLWRTFLTEQRALLTELPGVLEQLDRIETPTLVVAGTRDRVVPFSTARALAERLPNAELVPVPRAGHPLYRSHPDVVAGAVHRVLADVGAP